MEKILLNSRVFGAAICQKAKASIRESLREALPIRVTEVPLKQFAERLNPRVRGWINYFTKFNRQETYKVFYYLNELICKWIKNTYNIIHKYKPYKKYEEIRRANPTLFYHWKWGIKENGWTTRAI